MNAEPTISPQSTFEFQPSEDLPALPSSRASSPDADAKSNLELERKNPHKPGYGLERSENLPPLPCSRASSPDVDTDLNAKPKISPQSKFEFQPSEDLPALPSSRASSPDAKSNLEIERKTSPQPVYGLEPSEHPLPLPRSRATSPEFDIDLNVEPIISPQSTIEFHQRSDDLPELPSSRASSPDADIFHDFEMKIPLEPTLEFPSSEDLPTLPASRASSPDAEIYHDLKTEAHLEPALKSHGFEYLPAQPISHASSQDTYSTDDIKTEIALEATFESQGPEKLIMLPSRRTSSPDSDFYHEVQSTNLIRNFEDLPALPPSRASSIYSSNETEGINNKLGSKIMTQEKSITNLGDGLDSDEITGMINAEITESFQVPIERTRQSLDLLTSKENSLGDTKESESSLQPQPDVENVDTLSTPEKAIDIEPTVRLQESLSARTLTKAMTGDEVVAVMAVVAEAGTITHDKRSTTNSKKAKRNQKKTKQKDRPQASISEASDRASVQQEGMDDLSSQSFASKDPNMQSGESLVKATDLSTQILSTQLSPGENIPIKENAPPVKKSRKGKKNKKNAVETGPGLSSSKNASPQAARAVVLGSIAGEFDMEGAQLGGHSVKTVDQKSPKAASQSEIPPEAIALPIDDFDLLEAPSVRSIDRFSLPDSVSETTVLPVDGYQKPVLEAERPLEAVPLPYDTDLDLIAPTQNLETTVRGRYQSTEPEDNEAHEPFTMVAELHNSATAAIIPELLELTAGDGIDHVEASPQTVLLRKDDETSQVQGQVKYSHSEIPNSPITESLKQDLKPNIAAQYIALPPNADLDLLEASPPRTSPELTHTEWLDQPEPPINESLESVPAHERTPRAGRLPDSEDLGLQKSSSRSLSVGSTEQRSHRSEIGETKRLEETGSSTQLLKEATVLAPEFTALPSDTDPSLLGYLPRIMSLEVPQLNTQFDESKSDAAASFPQSPETPIVPAGHTTTIANSDLDFREEGLPSQSKEPAGHFSPAGEPIATLPKDVYDIQSDPETIALPVDDDLDFSDALYPSLLTHSQPESIDEPSLRSSTEVLSPNITPEIFVIPAAKDFRSLKALLVSSFAGPMPTIPEEVLEQEVAPENVKLPSDEDLELVEELSASPLADPIDSQLAAPEEPKPHPSREVNETEITPHITADEELDLPDALSNLDTIKLPNDEDLGSLEALPPSLYSDKRQVSQAGSITSPKTLSSSSPVEHISRSPEVLLEQSANPRINDIPAVEDFESRGAIPPSSPPLSPVNEQISRLPENFLTSILTPEVIALPADREFDLSESLPPNTWAGSQQGSGKETSSTLLTNIPEPVDVTPGIRADHDLAEAMPPSAFDKGMGYQACQHEELSPWLLKEPEITPQTVELPYDDDLDLLEALPPSPPASPTPELESQVILLPSPSTGSKENRFEQLEEKIPRGLESERVSRQSPLSRSVKSEDHSKPAKELVSTSLVLEVHPEATKSPVGDTLDSSNTLPPSPSTKFTDYQTRSLKDSFPRSPEMAPSIFTCDDGDPGLLEPRPEIFPADHETRSMEEPTLKSSGRAPSIVTFAVGEPISQEPRPEIRALDHQTGSLEDPIPELLEVAPSTVACADGDLGVPEARPELLSIDQSSQQTDLLDERISKWQNELVAELQLPPESIQLPADEDCDMLADLPPSSTKSIISDGLELRPLEQAPKPEKASYHALEPLKEIDSQVLPKHLPLPADEGLESLKALPERPLPESQVVPEDFPLPTDDDLDLLEALPESPLSESSVGPGNLPLPTENLFKIHLPEFQVVPKDLPLPTDDDLDLLEALPESPLYESPVGPENLPLPTENLPKSHLLESQVVPKDFPLPTDDDLDLLEALPVSPLSESPVGPEDLPLLTESHLPELQVVPKDLPLPTDDDLDLLEALPESPLSESPVSPEGLPLPTENLPKSLLSEPQVAPKDLPLPTDDDLELLEALPESPLSESLVVSDDFPLPTDDELDFPETLPKSPLPESQVTPRGFSLLTDGRLDLMSALPESPLPESSNKGDNGVESQHLEVEEHDPDSHHNQITADPSEPEVALDSLQLPANDDLDLETSPQSPSARSINPENKDVVPLEIEGLLKEEIKGEAIEDIEGAPDNAKGDTDKDSEDVGKHARSVAEPDTDGKFLKTTGISQDNGVHTGPSVGSNAKQDENNEDKNSANNPNFAPLELQTKPMWAASENQFIGDIASEPKEDIPTMELEEGKDGVVHEFGAAADEELSSKKNKGKKAKKSKSRATNSSVETSIPTTSSLLELPTKSAGGAVFEVPMQEKTTEVTSEEPELLNKDGDISKEGKKKTKKGKKNQEVLSKSGLNREEFELPKASVATLPSEGPNETAVSENPVRTNDIEGSQGHKRIEDEWLNEPKKSKQGKKAAENFPSPGGSTEIIESPLSKTMEHDLDFEDSQAQVLTEDERQKEPKKKGKNGKKSKDKKSKPSITKLGLPPMSSPIYLSDGSSSTDAAQIKALELSLNHPANTKVEASPDRKTDKADMKQISSFENTETAELRPGHLESEEIVSEVALQEAQVENQLPESTRKKARKEKKRKSRFSNAYREGSDSEKVESSRALSEPMPELFAAELTSNELELTQTMPGLESELLIPEEVRPKEDDDLHIGAQQIDPKSITPYLSLTKSLEPEQIEPGRLESRFADLEEPQPAQSHSVNIDPNQTESNFRSGKSLETNASEPKDLASGQPKSQLVQENPTESSLKFEPEHLEKENFTFNAASSVQEGGKPTPTPQEPASPERTPGEVAAPGDNIMRKNPSGIVDRELPIDLQGVEHSPTQEKNLATTSRKHPTSDAENNLVDTQEFLPLTREPATLTQLPSSTDQHPLALENSPFPVTGSSFTMTSDKSVALPEEPVNIKPPLSGKPFVAAKEVPVLSVDEFPATAEDLATFNSDQSPHHAKEPLLKDIHVSPEDKRVVGIEGALIRDVASRDKHPLAIEGPSAMKVPLSDKALVTLEEPAVVDVSSSNEFFVHVEDSSVTEKGPPVQSASPVKEPPAIEAPISARSSPTSEGHSILTVDEPSFLNVLAPAAKEHISHTETLPLSPDNSTSPVNEPPSTTQIELSSELDTHRHPYTVEDLTPASVKDILDTHRPSSTVEDLTPASAKDIETSAVIEIAVKPCEDELLSNAGQVPEDIFPQDDIASAKKSKKGKKSRKTVTTEQKLTVSDASSAAIKQEIEGHQPEKNLPMLENIIAAPKTYKSRGKMALKGTEQADELDLPDQSPIASDDIFESNIEAEPDKFGDGPTSSAVLEKQDDKSISLEEAPIAPIKKSKKDKKGKKGSKARKQANDDPAQPEKCSITPEEPSAILEKQDDELNQSEGDATTPEGLDAVFEKQSEIDEPIGPAKKLMKGTKGSKTREQRVVDELDQPEVVPILPKDPSTSLERQEVELDGIEDDSIMIKDLADIRGKQDEFDGTTALSKKAKKVKGSKKGRKREADKINQPEDSSVFLDELQSKEDPDTPGDFHAAFEKQEDALQAKEDLTLPEDLSTVSRKQNYELETKEGTIMPEEYLSGLEIQKDRLQIKEDKSTPENFLASPKTQEELLLTITPKDLSLSPETQEEQLDQNLIAPVGVPPGDLFAVSKKREVKGDEDLTAPDPATLEDLSAAPEKQEHEPEKLDEEPTEKAKKVKKGKKGSKARKREADELEQQDGISIVSEKQNQVDGSTGPDRITPDNSSALPAMQGRLEETPIAIEPITPEDLSSPAPESQVDEPEKLEDDNFAPDYSHAAKNAKKGKKGKKGKKQEIFTEFGQPEGGLMTSQVRAAAHEQQDAEPDQFGKKAKNNKKVKHKRQRFDDIPEEDPLDCEDFSATDLKETDQLDQPEEYPAVSGDLSVTHSKQIGSLNQPKKDQVISKDFYANNTKQINLLDQSEDPTASENPSYLMVDELDQTQEDPITSEELSALTGKLDQREQESIRPEELSAVLASTTIDENIHEPASSQKKNSQKGEKSKTQGVDKLDQLMELVDTEDIDTTLLKQEHELDQPKEPIAPKEIGPVISIQQDESNQPEQKSILPEAITPVITIEKGKKGKKARRQDKRGIEEPEEKFIASNHSAAVIGAFQPEDPTTTANNDAGAIQLKADAFDQVEEEPVAVKSPAVPERKKGKNTRQENIESAEHAPITSGDTFLPLEDDELDQLDQSGQGDIASADTVAEPRVKKSKKSKKGRKEKHVEWLGPSDQTIRAPEAASASQDILLDQPEQSTIASEESSAPQEQSAEIPLIEESKTKKKPKQYENLDRSDNEPITPPVNVASHEFISDISTSKQVGQDDETIQRSLNVPGPEPSEKVSALQADFHEITVAKGEMGRKSKKESQMNARSIPEEIIASPADASVPKLLPDGTREIALEPISQQVSDNISKPQDELQHERTKEAETGQQSTDMAPDLTVPVIEYRRTETPTAEEIHMDNSLSIQAEEATLQDHLVKPNVQQEFEDAGIRGEDNILLIEGYREATQSEPLHGHPSDQRENVAVQALPATAALDSVPSDITVQLQNQVPLAEMAERDVEHTYPTKILNSYDVNPFVELEKGDELRHIPETSQTLHPSDGYPRTSTPLLEAKPAEPHDRRLVELERPKSSALTNISSDIDLNLATYSVGLTETEKSVPELPPIGPAFRKSTPTEDPSAPEWELKPAKKSKKEKKSKKKALSHESLNTEESLGRGTAYVSEGATLAGDVDFKLTKEIEEDLPEISLTGADFEKSTPVEELGLTERRLKLAKKGKKEKKSKKKASDSISVNTDEVFEQESAVISEGAALAGDLDLKLAVQFGEDLPEISLTKAVAENFTPIEELSDPESGPKPTEMSEREKKSETKALHSDFLSTREILEKGPGNFSEVPALDRHRESKPTEGLTVPELDVPELPMTDTDAGEQLSEAGIQSAKKTKKDEKSHNRAWDTDSMITGKILAREPADTLQDLARDSDFKPSELAGPEEGTPELQQIDNNADESIPVEDPAMTEIRPIPSKKGKKDKKSKSTVMASDSLPTEESLDPAASKTPAMEAPTVHNPHESLIAEESIPNDNSTRAESGFSVPKKSRKNKKSKDGAIASGSLVPRATELPTKSPAEHLLREFSDADKSISIEDSTIPKSRPLPSEKSKKKTKNQRMNTQLTIF